MACPPQPTLCVTPYPNSLIIRLWCCLNSYQVSGPICGTPGGSGREAASPADPGVRHVTAREPIDPSVPLVRGRPAAMPRQSRSLALGI